MARSAQKSSKAKKRKKSGSVTVNMEGVESGGRTIDDGWAKGRIKEAELTTSSNDNEMFNIKWEATRGKVKATVFDHIVLTPNALWKLRNLLEACGVDVPEGDMTVSEEDLVDLECMIEITNEEYEGKERPRVTAYKAEGDAEEEDDEEEDEEEDDSDDDTEDDDDEEDEEEEDEEEEEPPKKKKAASKRRAKDEDDDDNEDEEDDDDSDDEDEDEEEDDEEESDDDDDEEEEDEDDDEDDEPAPKSKKKTSKKSKPKLKAGMKVSFEDDKGKPKKGVITSIDGDTVFVEDSKGTEWELEEDEIALV